VMLWPPDAKNGEDADADDLALPGLGGGSEAEGGAADEAVAPQPLRDLKAGFGPEHVRLIIEFLVKILIIVFRLVVELPAAAAKRVDEPTEEPPEP